jgi:beta-catenin-like protein 1
MVFSFILWAKMFRYIDSEADLFTAVASFTFLSEHADLYPVLVGSGAFETLMKLFAHENVDIAIAVLEVLVELSGEDVDLKNESDMQILIDGIFKDDAIEVIVENLERFDETKDDDRQGVFHTLSKAPAKANVLIVLAVLENITSFSPSYANRLPVSLLKWLLSRIENKERPISQNKQYAAEILSIILQLSRQQLQKALSLEINALDILLTQLAPYRKRDPAKNSDEEQEFLENLFDSLCTCVQIPEGKTQFLSLEGVDLCLLFLKGDGKIAKSRALKALDFAVGGVGGDAVAEALVENSGLKTLFGIFMRKVSSPPNAFTNM